MVVNKLCSFVATKTVDSYEFTFGGLRHVLVDTPGFDDNTVSDQDILADICTWLSSSHGEDARVSAIIYMHRITDTRIQGSAMSNFHRFSRLCGKDSLSRVSLCTTFWDIYGPDPGAAEARFQQLQQPEFWGKMVQKGSTIYKAPSTQRQAREFVHSLANRRPVISDAEAPEETAEMLDLKQLMEQREQYDGKLLEAKRQLEQEMAKRAESEAKRLEALQQAFEEKLKIQNLAKEKAEAEIAQLHRKMSEQTQKNNNLMKQAENIRVRRTRTDVVDKFQQAVVARQRKFDQFMVNVATSARILQTGKQNKHVKCDIATTKQCYTVVCNHCLQNIGSRPYYGMIFSLRCRSFH